MPLGVGTGVYHRQDSAEDMKDSFSRGLYMENRE